MGVWRWKKFKLFLTLSFARCCYCIAMWWESLGCYTLSLCRKESIYRLLCTWKKCFSLLYLLLFAVGNITSSTTFVFLHLSRVIRRLRRVMVETYAPPTFVRQDRPTRRVEFPNQTILSRDVGTTGEWLTHLTDYRARLYTRQPSIRSKQVG